MNNRHRAERSIKRHIAVDTLPKRWIVERSFT